MYPINFLLGLQWLKLRLKPVNDSQTLSDVGKSIKYCKDHLLNKSSVKTSVTSYKNMDTAVSLRWVINIFVPFSKKR